MIWAIRKAVRPSDELRLTRDIIKQMFGLDDAKFAEHVKVVFTFSDEPADTADDFLKELCNPDVEEEGVEEENVEEEGQAPTAGNLPVPQHYFFGKNTEKDVILG